MLSTLAAEPSERPLCELHLGSTPARVDEPATRPLPRASYLAGLRSSTFALCPQGNNPETFRHWEALALGAIPVSVKPQTAADRDRSFLQPWCGGGGFDGFDGLGAGGRLVSGRGAWSLADFASRGCPVVLLDSWADLPAFLRRFQALSQGRANDSGTTGGDGGSSEGGDGDGGQCFGTAACLAAPGGVYSSSALLGAALAAGSGRDVAEVADALQALVVRWALRVQDRAAHDAAELLA